MENIISRRDDDKDYGAVWAIMVPKQYFLAPEQIGNVDKVTEWLMVNPPPVTNRLARQSGKFSYHPHSDSLKPISKLDRRAGERLVKIEIEERDGKNPTLEIRQQLGIMNIHHAALFPDPDGIAEFINHEWPIIADEEHLQKK